MTKMFPRQAGEGRPRKFQLGWGLFSSLPGLLPCLIVFGLSLTRAQADPTALASEGLTGTKCPNSAIPEAQKTTYDLRHLWPKNSIRDQGQLGTCNIFATAALLEANIFLTKGRHVDLSERDLAQLELMEELDRTKPATWSCNNGNGKYYIEAAGTQNMVARALSLGVLEEKDSPYHPDLTPFFKFLEDLKFALETFDRQPSTKSNDAALLLRAVKNLGDMPQNFFSSSKFLTTAILSSRALTDYEKNQITSFLKDQNLRESVSKKSLEDAWKILQKFLISESENGKEKRRANLPLLSKVTPLQPIYANSNDPTLIQTFREGALSSIFKNLASGKPVGISMNHYYEWSQFTDSEPHVSRNCRLFPIKLPEAKPGEGHSIVIAGYDSKTDEFIIRNSWGGAMERKAHHPNDDGYERIPRVALEYDLKGFTQI